MIETINKLTYLSSDASGNGREANLKNGCPNGHAEDKDRQSNWKIAKKYLDGTTNR